MAFPTVISRTAQRIGDGFSYGGTTHNVAIPAHEVGDLVILIFAPRQDITSTPAGWTVLSVAGFHYHCVVAKIMDGTEGPNATFTIASTGNSTTHKYVIRDFMGFPEAATSTSGDAPALSPSWGEAETLWIAAINNTGGSNRISTGGPANYTNHFCTFASNTFTVDNVVASAEREHVAASENPGAFSSSQANKSVTIAIQGIPSPSETVETDVFTVSFDPERTRTIATDIEYAVKPSDSIAKNLVYKLDVDVVEQLDTQYTIATDHLLDVEQVYKVIPTTTEQFTIDYAVEYGTALTKAITCKLTDTNEVTKSILYSISDDVALQLALHYELETSSQVNVGIHYELIAGETVPKSLTYTLLDEKLTQRTITYEVLTDDSLSLSSRYAMVTKPYIPMTIEYELLSPTSFIKPLRYSVVSPEHLMLAEKYSVISTSTEELTLEYGIVPPPVSIPLTLQYKLAVPKTPLELSIVYVLIPYPYSKFCDNPYSKATSPFSPATLPYGAMATPYSAPTTPYKIIPAVTRACPVETILDYALRYDVIIWPAVTMTSASAITTVSANLNGNITIEGNSPIVERGFVLGTSSQPTPGNVAPASSGYALSVSQTGTYTTGAYTINRGGLTHTTNYRARAYVRTQVGNYRYSTNEISFFTLSNQGGGGGAI